MTEHTLKISSIISDIAPVLCQIMVDGPALLNRPSQVSALRGLQGILTDRGYLLSYDANTHIVVGGAINPGFSIPNFSNGFVPNPNTVLLDHLDINYVASLAVEILHKVAAVTAFPDGKVDFGGRVYVSIERRNDGLGDLCLILTNSAQHTDHVPTIDEVEASILGRKEEDGECCGCGGCDKGNRADNGHSDVTPKTPSQSFFDKGMRIGGNIVFSPSLVSSFTQNPIGLGVTLHFVAGKGETGFENWDIEDRDFFTELPSKLFTVAPFTQGVELVAINPDTDADIKKITESISVICPNIAKYHIGEKEDLSDKNMHVFILKNTEKKLIVCFILIDADAPREQVYDDIIKAIIRSSMREQERNISALHDHTGNEFHDEGSSLEEGIDELNDAFKRLGDEITSTTKTAFKIGKSILKDVFKG